MTSHLDRCGMQLRWIKSGFKTRLWSGALQLPRSGDRAPRDFLHTCFPPPLSLHHLSGQNQQAAPFTILELAKPSPCLHAIPE
jgi:hypothetical protein